MYKKTSKLEMIELVRKIRNLTLHMSSGLSNSFLFQSHATNLGATATLLINTYVINTETLKIDRSYTGKLYILFYFIYLFIDKL
jgi:hypothetical protein